LTLIEYRKTDPFQPIVDTLTNWHMRLGIMLRDGIRGRIGIGVKSTPVIARDLRV